MFGLHILTVFYFTVIFLYEMQCLTQGGDQYSEGTSLHSLIVTSYRLPGTSNRIVPFVRKSSGGDSVKPSGGKLHTFKSKEDRHQRDSSRLTVKRENRDLGHRAQGEQFSLFIICVTEKL
jgi:hypothetical protein